LLERRSLVERERGLVVLVVLELVIWGLEGLRRVLSGFWGILGVVGAGAGAGAGLSDLGRRIEEELVGSGGGGGGGGGLREKEMEAVVVEVVVVVVVLEEKGGGQ
jgi:hypothetical protein